jgi:hypothetical protein
MLGLGTQQTLFGFQGDLNGLLRLNTHGGKPNDVSVNNIDATVTSQGKVVARVVGGPADDNLTLNVRQPPGVCLLPPCTLLIDARINGGPGFDVCHATSNVTKINCEA